MRSVFCCHGERWGLSRGRLKTKSLPVSVFQCQMTVTMVSPLPHPFRSPAAGPESIKSNGRSEDEHRLWLILLPYSHRSKYISSHISSEHFDSKMTFFRRTNQEKINFYLGENSCEICHYSLWCWTFSTRESLRRPRPLRRQEVYDFVPLVKPTVHYL